MSSHRSRLEPLPLAVSAGLWTALTVLSLVLTAPAATPTPAATHPSHEVKVWVARFKGRNLHVARLPRCKHLQAVITNEPSGETRERAKQRVGGVASMTGTFHHPRTLSLADFLQRDGAIESAAHTGRWFLVILADGSVDITGNYAAYEGKSGVSAMALGQRLVPLHQDGFSTHFMNQVTERMAIGLTRDCIYLVEGKTDIWRLATFMQDKLHVTIAINSDGGHVVRGRAPVHLVFRWRKAPTPNEAAKAAAQPASPGRPDQALLPDPRPWTAWCACPAPLAPASPTAG